MSAGWIVCSLLKNGTFLAPTITIPMMMFAGFGVTLRDLPEYMKWGSHVSFMRYGLEGFVGAIYGEGRKTLDCNAIYCHYRWALESWSCDCLFIYFVCWIYVLPCMCLSVQNQFSIRKWDFTTIFFSRFPSHFRYPSQFFTEISMRGDQFWPCFNALIFTVLVLRLGAYILLRWKVIAVR